MKIMHSHRLYLGVLVLVLVSVGFAQVYAAEPLDSILKAINNTGLEFQGIGPVSQGTPPEEKPHPPAGEGKATVALASSIMPGRPSVAELRDRIEINVSGRYSGKGIVLEDNRLDSVEIIYAMPGNKREQLRQEYPLPEKIVLTVSESEPRTMYYLDVVLPDNVLGVAGAEKQDIAMPEVSVEDYGNLINTRVEGEREPYEVLVFVDLSGGIRELETRLILKYPAELGVSGKEIGLLVRVNPCKERPLDEGTAREQFARLADCYRAQALLAEPQAEAEYLEHMAQAQDYLDNYLANNNVVFSDPEALGIVLDDYEHTAPYESHEAIEIAENLGKENPEKILIVRNRTELAERLPEYKKSLDSAKESYLKPVSLFEKASQYYSLILEDAPDAKIRQTAELFKQRVAADIAFWESTVNLHEDPFLEANRYNYAEALWDVMDTKKAAAEILVPVEKKDVELALGGEFSAEGDFIEESGETAFVSYVHYKLGERYGRQSALCVELKSIASEQGLRQEIRDLALKIDIIRNPLKYELGRSYGARAALESVGKLFELSSWVPKTESTIRAELEERMKEADLLEERKTELNLRLVALGELTKHICGSEEIYNSSLWDGKENRSSLLKERWIRTESILGLYNRRNNPPKEYWKYNANTDGWSRWPALGYAKAFDIPEVMDLVRVRQYIVDKKFELDYAGAQALVYSHLKPLELEKDSLTATTILLAEKNADKGFWDEGLFHMAYLGWRDILKGNGDLINKYLENQGRVFDEQVGISKILPRLENNEKINAIKEDVLAVDYVDFAELDRLLGGGAQKEGMATASLSSFPLKEVSEQYGSSLSIGIGLYTAEKPIALITGSEIYEICKFEKGVIESCSPDGLEGMFVRITRFGEKPSFEVSLGKGKDSFIASAFQNPVVNAVAERDRLTIKLEDAVGEAKTDAEREALFSQYRENLAHLAYLVPLRYEELGLNTKAMEEYAGISVDYYDEDLSKSTEYGTLAFGRGRELSKIFGKIYWENAGHALAEFTSPKMLLVFGAIGGAVKSAIYIRNAAKVAQVAKYGASAERAAIGLQRASKFSSTFNEVAETSGFRLAKKTLTYDLVNDTVKLFMPNRFAKYLTQEVSFWKNSQELVSDLAKYRKGTVSAEAPEVSAVELSGRGAGETLPRLGAGERANIKVSTDAAREITIEEGAGLSAVRVESAEGRAVVKVDNFDNVQGLRIGRSSEPGAEEVSLQATFGNPVSAKAIPKGQPAYAETVTSGREMVTEVGVPQGKAVRLASEEVTDIRSVRSLMEDAAAQARAMDDAAVLADELVEIEAIIASRTEGAFGLFANSKGMPSLSTQRYMRSRLAGVVEQRESVFISWENYGLKNRFNEFFGNEKLADEALEKYILNLVEELESRGVTIIEKSQRYGSNFDFLVEPANGLSGIFKESAAAAGRKTAAEFGVIDETGKIKDAARRVLLEERRNSKPTAYYSRMDDPNFDLGEMYFDGAAGIRGVPIAENLSAEEMNRFIAQVYADATAGRMLARAKEGYQGRTVLSEFEAMEGIVKGGQVSKIADWEQTQRILAGLTPGERALVYRENPANIINLSKMNLEMNAPSVRLSNLREGLAGRRFSDVQGELETAIMEADVSYEKVLELSVSDEKRRIVNEAVSEYVLNRLKYAEKKNPSVMFFDINDLSRHNQVRKIIEGAEVSQGDLVIREVFETAFDMAKTGRGVRPGTAHIQGVSSSNDIMIVVGDFTETEGREFFRILNDRLAVKTDLAAPGAMKGPQVKGGIVVGSEYPEASAPQLLEAAAFAEGEAGILKTEQGITDLIKYRSEMAKISYDPLKSDVLYRAELQGAPVAKIVDNLRGYSLGNRVVLKVEDVAKNVRPEAISNPAIEVSAGETALQYAEREAREAIIDELRARGLLLDASTGRENPVLAGKLLKRPDLRSSAEAELVFPDEVDFAVRDLIAPLNDPANQLKRDVYAAITSDLELDRFIKKKAVAAGGR